MTSDAEWDTAERTLREHYAAANVELLDVTQKRDATLGVSFWVRFAKGGGGLAIVRGREVIADPSPASVDRWIEVDQLARRAGVEPDDFLYVLTTWKALPALHAKVIQDHDIESLNPHWDREHGATAFTMCCSRKGPAVGARNRPTIPIQRATGTLGDRGITWKVDDEDVPRDRDEMS